jgi:ABC-type cobalamin transport system permease subunit
MSTQTPLPRPRWYAAAVIGAVVAIAVFSAAALFTDDDLADGTFGFFTGAISMLLIATVLWIEIGRQRLARKRDAAALDALEPLRVASAADTTAPADTVPDASVER